MAYWVDEGTGRRVGPFKEMCCWILYGISYIIMMAIFALVTSAILIGCIAALDLY